LRSEAVATADPSPRVSVVVCTYTDDRWAQLCATIRSLTAQTAPPAQIVVVVDHNEGLAARARAALPDVDVVENTGPRGLSGARNTGIDASSGGIVAFIDDDAVADQRWIERLCAPFDSTTVVGSGGVAFPDWARVRPPWFPAEFDWVVGCTYRGMPTSTARIRNPIGCNMAFRRVVFETVGGFRSDLGRIGAVPVGAEETELSVRIADQLPLSRIVHVPDAVVHHAVPEARSTIHYFLRRCYGEGISKAALGRIAGRTDTLGTEWSYVARTLPSGVMIGIGHALLRRDPWGVARAGAIVLGLALGAAGFMVGNLRRSGAAALS